MTQAVPAPHALAQALPFFLLSGFAFASLDATAKYLVHGHGLLLVVWARYVGQMLVATPFAWHRGGGDFWRTRQLPLQLIRSAFLVLATGCFYAGLAYLPLAEGSAILLLTPMMVVVLSLPLLGERPTRARWAAAGGGFIGVLILLRPGSEMLQPAAALPIAAAVFSALFQILTRRLQYESAYTTLFYTALVGAAGLTLALPWAFEVRVPGLFASLLFLLLGVFAGLGHFWVISAYQRAPASLLTPFMYVQMLWVTAYGYLIFDQLPDGGSALGMLVIAGSGLFLALAERRRALAT